MPILSRLNSELNDLRANPILGVEIKADSFNSLRWEAIIKGPQGSLYEGGKFIVGMQIPQNYPFSPPYFWFETMIFHPNISQQGELLCSVLKTACKSNWDPTHTIKSIINDILNLLTCVHIEYPVNQNAMKLYLTNQKQYNKEVRKCVKYYAI